MRKTIIVWIVTLLLLSLCVVAGSRRPGLDVTGLDKIATRDKYIRDDIVAINSHKTGKMSGVVRLACEYKNQMYMIYRHDDYVTDKKRVLHEGAAYKMVRCQDGILEFSVASFSSYAAQLYEGLVAYYPFDENADDLTGENDGTVQGATLTSEDGGVIDEAYEFDGDNDYISASYHTDTVFSYSLWAKASSIGDAYYITSGDSNKYAGNLAISSAGKVGMTIGSADSWNFNGDTTLVADQWYHIAATFDGTTKKIYIDGELESSNDGVGSVETDTAYEVGRRSDNVGHYSGILDEFGVWNRTLDDDEVEALYASGDGLRPLELYLDWISPTDDALYYDENVPLSYITNMPECEYRLNSDSWIALDDCTNTTIVGISGNNHIEMNVSNNDTHIYEVRNFTVARDIVIDISVPEEGVTYESPPFVVYSIDDPDDTIENCSYAVDGVEDDITCGDTFQLPNLEDGNYTLTIYAENLNSDIFSESVNFRFGEDGAVVAVQPRFSGVSVNECDYSDGGSHFLLGLIAFSIFLMIWGYNKNQMIWMIWGSLALFITSMVIYPCFTLFGAVMALGSLFGFLYSVLGMISR